jgi:flagellar basal-body rod modification protein FlgD
MTGRPSAWWHDHPRFEGIFHEDAIMNVHSYQPSYTLPAAQGPVPSNDPQKTLADMDSFLLMFTTQLQHQDPTNPMESHEMAAQLAQFSTVEQLTKINGTLQTQENYLSSINNTQLLSLIGKYVTAADDRIRVNGGEVSQSGFRLEAPAEVTVSIQDADGRVVRTLDLGVLEAGEHALAWDGTDSQGKTVPDGVYTFQVEATDAQGQPLEATATVSDSVYGFNMEEGQSYLVLGGADGLKVPIGALLHIRDTIPEPEPTEGASL